MEHPNQLLPGMKFGRLMVIAKSFRHDKNGAAFYDCVCSCGGKRTVRAADLIRGKTRSCGCLQRERHYKIHGESKTPLYRTWCAMKSRTTNRNTDGYSLYGGRGISVCEEWAHDFAAFRDWALANGYQDGLSIDRIDPDGNYCPENCRWITMAAQQRNKRNNHYMTFQGETKTVTEWASISGIRYQTIQSRIRRGWATDQVLGTPVRR